MSDPRLPQSPGEPEPDLERMIGETLRPHALSDEALGRMQAVVEAEWRATIGRRTPGRRAWPISARVAIVAALAMAAGTLAWWRPANHGAVIGELLRFDAGGVELRLAPLQRRPLQVGDPIRAGDRLEVRGAALIALGKIGTLRIAGGSVLVAGAADAVNLERGRIYVDLPPGEAHDTAFRILTREGAVEHLGTAFEVLSDEQAVRVRVREGEIRWLLISGATLATAGTQLTVTPDGRVGRAEVATDGRDWAWAEALAPEYRIEGRSLAEFLEQVSRELGFHVEFADDHAREVAARTVLHGSAKVRDPREALETVIATTSLSYEIHGAAIRVHSTP